MIHNQNFKILLNNIVKRSGGHSACCIRMDHPDLPSLVEKNNLKVAEWLKRGKHGDMDYLERMYFEKSNPWRTFPNAKAMIVIAFTNKWGDEDATHPFPEPNKNSLKGYISAYAKEIDYHKKGQKILSDLSKILGYSIKSEIAVDTKPVYERLFATFGGLGIIGANDLLRVPDRINVRVFIGVLFVDAELPNAIHTYSMPFKCEDCMACIKNCPTNAIQPGQSIDSNRCISYLTIEKRSILSQNEGIMINDWIFGCDDCSNVCPPKDKIDTRIPIDLEWILKTPSAEIRRLIKNNATSYAGVTQLRKNAVVVLKNYNNRRSNDLLKWTSLNNKSKLIQEQLVAW